MDCFNDVLATFLGLKIVCCIAVYSESVRKLSDFNKNILICVPINEDD